MSAEKPTENQANSSLTPARAVLLGQLAINLPVLFIMGMGTLLGFHFKGSTGAFAGLLLGAIPAWLWWSFYVPRWREWAKEKGADEERTQTLAMRSGLAWPKGHFFEKTEFRPRKKS